MKRSLKFLSFITILGGLFFGGMQKNDEPVIVEAAETNTKRVWMHTEYVDWWTNDPDTTGLGIHYWGGSSETTWPGVEMKYDSENDLHYYDVPINTTEVVFTRFRRSDNHVFNQTVDIELETYTNEYRYEIWTDEEWGKNKYGAVAFTPETTTVVTNLADSIDTSEKACSEASANNAVNTYNAMSTFEQSQFNSLELEGGVTGLQRLNYLRNFYNIPTPLRAPDLSNSRRDDNAQAVFALTIGGAGITILAGLYTYRKRRNQYV